MSPKYRPSDFHVFILELESVSFLFSSYLILLLNFISVGSACVLEANIVCAFACVRLSVRVCVRVRLLSLRILRFDVYS